MRTWRAVRFSPLLALVVACAPAATPTPAAPGPPAPAAAPAAPAFSPALTRVIEGAKKEGVLKLQFDQGRLGGDEGRKALIDGMNRRYATNIKLQFTPLPYSTLPSKLAQEKAAGQPSSTDLMMGNSQHLLEGQKTGILRKTDWNAILERPEPAHPSLSRVTLEGLGVAFASRIVGITYNTNLVKGDDVPVSMEDVFKPKWKGKIASTPFATGLSQFAAEDMLGYEYMKDYTQRLAQLVGGLIICSDVDRIASGEFAMMVFDCGNDDFLRFQRKGAPVGQTPVKEIARINILYFALVEHAEHPNAGILFSAFLHTEEGQRLQWEHAGHDLHLYPEAKTREPVLKVLEGKGGKLQVDSVERELEIGAEEALRVRNEFIKILREGGR